MNKQEFIAALKAGETPSFVVIDGNEFKVEMADRVSSNISQFLPITNTEGERSFYLVQERPFDFSSYNDAHFLRYMWFGEDMIKPEYYRKEFTCMATREKMVEYLEKGQYAPSSLYFYEDGSHVDPAQALYLEGITSKEVFQSREM